MIDPSADATDALARYRAKRDFGLTSEPRGGTRTSRASLPTFVIQKHDASRLHYDLRLELDGVLVSWAVPKGPSLDPSVKRLAVRVEDHPLEYGAFEGTIPPKQYGAGTVIVWDRGAWEPVGDPREGLAAGKLAFRLDGHKLAGLWELIRTGSKRADGAADKASWLLFKKRDAHARPADAFDVLSALPDSVLPTGRKPSARPSKRAARKPVTPSTLPGAVPGRAPARLAPQLATLASRVPATGEWLYEIKFDGYRLLTRWTDGVPTLFTRGGHDWTARLPALAKALARLNVTSGWLDGEIVVPGPDGQPDFGALQRAFEHPDGQKAVVYFVFDVPWFEGHDLRQATLRDRRAVLAALLADSNEDRVRFSSAFDADPASILDSACRMNLEGVIAKRADSPYVSRRSPTWLKLKCARSGAFVVAGFTDRSDGSPQIGSLILGERGPDGRLIPVGRVGTGWRAADAARLRTLLARRIRATPPFDDIGGRARSRWRRSGTGDPVWVEPERVAEVTYAERTEDGQIRHASFVGLLDDRPRRSEGLARSTRGNEMNRIPISHGDRVIDPSTGLTKLDLVRYYDAVADRILPHLKGRPCSLVRAPDGVDGKQFFQKHGDTVRIPGIRSLDPDLWPAHDPLLEVSSRRGLRGAAQMNVIEFHTWGSTTRNIDRPDRMVFDIDPGDGTPWAHVRDAAALLRTFLEDLGLPSWLKTSGGKGLHVVVPIRPAYPHATLKAFTQAIVQHMAEVVPTRFVAKSGPRNRVGKVFIDYLRNAHGATTVAAFSARARPGLGVSMPVAWEGLAGISGGAQWTVSNAVAHLQALRDDPWATYGRSRPTLARGMEMLGFESDESPSVRLDPRRSQP